MTGDKAEQLWQLLPGVSSAISPAVLWHKLHLLQFVVDLLHIMLYYKL